MPSPNENEITVMMPHALSPAASTDVLKLEIAVDKNGARLANRSFRDANGSDTGRRQRLEWEIGGAPIGASLQSTSGRLGPDFYRNMESRWPRQLGSVLAQTAVTLTSKDPPGKAGSFFGSAIFGSSYFGSPAGSGSSGAGPDVTHFAEMQGYLLVGRGQLLTQVQLSNWAVISTTVLAAPVLDMDEWQGNVYIALGSSEPMLRVVSCSASGMTFENVVATSPAGAVYASAVKRGSDRAWYIDADQSGQTYNFLGYTLDAFVTLASPFQVGDPMVGMNGIGTFGSLTAVGEADAVYTFTDAGKPAPLSRALDALHSVINGSQFADPGFGWNYYLAITGLRAHTFTGVDNPVGIGPALRNFSGHNGIATAVFAALGELLIVFQTQAGDLYGYRGLFDPQRTQPTGQPGLFPWFYAAAETCLALFSSTTPNAPITTTQAVTLIRASGTNLKYQTVAANEMDNLQPNLGYDIGGGSAYLTTYDTNPNLLRTARLARVRAAGMATGDVWSLALGFDTDPNNPVGSSYTTIGTVTANGEHTVTPTTGAVDQFGNPTPTANISGHTIKPLVSLVAAGAGASTTPPVLRGTFELELDERPEQIQVVTASVKITTSSISPNQFWTYLRQLVGADVNGPLACYLPDDLQAAVYGASGGGQVYVQFNKVSDRLDKDATTQAVQVELLIWPMAEALSNT